MADVQLKFLSKKLFIAGLLSTLLQACAITYRDVGIELENHVQMQQSHMDGLSYWVIEWRGIEENNLPGKSVQTYRAKVSKNECIDKLDARYSLVPGKVYAAYQIIECMKSKGFEPYLEAASTLTDKQELEDITYVEIAENLEGTVASYKYASGSNSWHFSWRSAQYDESTDGMFEPVDDALLLKIKTSKNKCINALSEKYPVAPGLIYGGYQLIECMKSKGFIPVIVHISIIA